ncbi:hypothetical protein O181_119807 [Austropuccinia psidii MF-1]|uniref:Uncharacterized protein n=1 Tax=Austropuccinia psidii MF-1 TaxID=1389203 RepID=A0A9Q3KFV8_9BASI|nr:hypothetical protein [Austropuccinia psidii MF-1]
MFTKWANNCWRFKMENAFESAIFNSEKDKPLTWFFKQKDRISALHPDMSDTIINMKIKKSGGELEHAIKCKCEEPCSIEDYINEMEDIITRTKIVQVIEEVPCTEEKEESDLYSAVSEDTPIEDYFIANITAFFEVTEVHTHLPQYSEDCHNLINIQDSRICETIPARGKGYTAGKSCITSVLMNDIEAKVNLDTGEFCTCVAKYYLQTILPGWKNHLLPIEGVQFSSSSNTMYPLGILDTNPIFPRPAGSIRIVTTTSLSLLLDGCGNPTWSQLATSYHLWPIGPLWVSNGSYATAHPNGHILPSLALLANSHLTNPQAFIIDFGPGGSFLSSRGLQAP